VGMTTAAGTPTLQVSTSDYVRLAREIGVRPMGEHASGQVAACWSKWSAGLLTIAAATWLRKATPGGWRIVHARMLGGEKPSQRA